MNKTIRVIQLFVAGFLLVAGVDFFLNSTVESTLRIVISALLIIDGFVYIVFIFSQLHKRLLLFLFNLFLFVNIVLTYTDEIGTWDYLILFSNLILLIYFLHYFATSKNKA